MPRWLQALWKGPAPSPAQPTSPTERFAVGLRNIPGAIIEVEGIPQPQWELFRLEAEKLFPNKDPALLWHSAAMEWLEILQKALGVPYQVRESANFIFLSAKEAARHRYIERASESALNQLNEHFGEAARCEAFGKFVFLFFEDESVYFRYISHFYPDGRHPYSGAVFINRGYGHIVLKPGYSFDATLVHELTHNVLAHLPLPLWLNEGLAQHMEEKFAGFVEADNWVEEDREYWNTETIQDFWWGRSFDRESTQELSYGLARILMRLMYVDFSGNIQAFIAHANAQDCGQSAAQEYLKTTLGQIASIFLGPGDWEPELLEPKGSTPSLDFNYHLVCELIRAKRIAEAKSHWERALEQARFDHEKIYILTNVAWMPIYESVAPLIPEALKICERLAQLSPDHEMVELACGALLMKAGQVDQATAHLIPLVEESVPAGVRAPAGYLMALAHFKKGNRPAAESLLERSIALDPDSNFRIEVEVAMGKEGLSET